MLKERIQEIFDFTKSESPYRKANKGWINQNIFLDLSPSPDAFLRKTEAAKVTVFWSPLNTLLSKTFIIIITCSILVFTSLSFVKGRFNFDFIHNSFIQDLVKVEDNKVFNLDQQKDLESITAENDQNIAIIELDKINNIKSIDDNQSNSSQETKIAENDIQEILIKDEKKNIGIKMLENKKSKSNFI